MENVDERGEIVRESPSKFPVEVVIDSGGKAVVATGFPSLIFIVLSLSLQKEIKILIKIFVSLGDLETNCCVTH